jgi:hypothetical protein
MSNATNKRAASTVGVLLGVLLLYVVNLRGSVSDFVPTLEWLTLDQVNTSLAADTAPLTPFELNTADSQIRLLGEFDTNYRVSWSPAIDSTRGLLYVAEARNANYDNSGGSVAVGETREFAKSATVKGRIRHESCT